MFFGEKRLAKTLILDSTFSPQRLSHILLRVTEGAQLTCLSNMTKPKSSSNSGNGYSTVLDSLQKVIHSRQRLLESISRAGGTGVAFAAGGGIAVEQIDSLRELEEKAMAELVLMTFINLCE